MRSFRFSYKSRWISIGTWSCKYEPGTDFCGCCQPKNVVGPGVLKHPDPFIREIFRQKDSTGKSPTPRSSKRRDRSIEVQQNKGRQIC